jgi:membrane-bound lytic murein transglycosylase D
MGMQRVRTSRLSSIAGALAASSLLFGCAAHDPGHTGTVASAARPERPANVELARAAHADRLEHGASSERTALELRGRLDQSWEQGQASWLAGDLESAFDSFDAGLDAVLVSGLDLDAHPDLRRRVDDILEGVHHLAVDEAMSDESAGPAAPELPSLGEAAAPGERLAAAPPVLRTVHQTTPDWLVGSTGGYTIPMRDDPAVDAMVRFYTQKKRDHLERGLSRAGLYGPTVARIFEEEGVPADLMWLAVVESNYRTSAYSRARAKGLWQFIPATGKSYGLDQDFWVDERADFEKSTRSSARYMKYLHGLFGDWHLALAAYNAGEGKVGRGIARTGRKDYWHLRRTRHLRDETKSYVPAMLAVMRIVRDPDAYGVNFQPSEPLQWETAKVTACADLSVLADCAGTSVETLKLLNPELRRGCTPGDADDYALRVPTGSVRTFQTAFAQLPPEKRLKWTSHQVRRGETLSTIARRYGSSVAGIMAANKLRSADRIGVGWKLLIPRGDTAGSLSSTAIAENTPDRTRSSTRSTKTSAYRVRPGDTLASIAKRHGTSVKSISRQNGIRNANRIRPGQRLTITGSARASAPSQAKTYTVRRGDTLSGIAGRHGTSVAQLRDWNGIGRSGLIHPGQVLAVRGAKTYDVRSGDTLSAIARRFDTSVSQIRKWNDLNRKGLIHPGDRLTILAN